jgi:hypothetical protein
MSVIWRKSFMTLTAGKRDCRGEESQQRKNQIY